MSVIEFPVQLVNGPLEVTVGTAGAAVAVTTVGEEVAEQEPDVILTV